MLTYRQQIINRLHKLMDTMHSPELTDELFEKTSDLIGMNLGFFVNDCRGLAPAYNKLQHAGLGEVFEIYYPMD